MISSKQNVYGEGHEEFPFEFGVKQGCVLFPTLFNYCIDLVLENALFSHPGVKIRQNVSPGDLEYADDFRILYDSEKDQTIIDDVVTLADRIGPKVITEKRQNLW
ncbi:hypothetical protein QYM36_000564 [Artemia franciscana]|uniref:Reverse transcriptase domain-containing protein n=1 Tax=Artemia franciscana TaxID=6661 RepID=A0AA88LCB7_ARTSF|nr:hypothetical protein QYM36_000564 [Artemia franciscana]